MNGTTEQPKAPKFPAGYLTWLYSLAIAAMVFIFFIMLIMPAAKQMFHLQEIDFAPPHVAAGGLIVKQGISEFSTGKPEPIPASATWNIFLSLLVDFVVAPTVIIFFVLRARRRRESGMSEKKTGVNDILAAVVFIIAMVLVAKIVVDTAVGSYVSPSIFTRMAKENDVSFQRDRLSNNLMNAYVDYMQYYYQTERFGGRNRNIIVDGAAPARSPEELGMKTKGEFGTLYLEPVLSDTLIVLDAVGKVRGNAERFRNADGDSGKIQCSLIIRPSSHAYELRQTN